MTLDKEHAEELRKLDLLVGDIDLVDELNSLLGGFNIFHAVGLGRTEIKHCHFLAYLLNPAENHYLGDLFLRGFLDQCISQIDGKGLVGISSISRSDLYLRDLTGASVRREVGIDRKKRLDLLIKIPSNNRYSKALIIVVEAKIDARESKGQLEHYSKWIFNEYPEDKNEHLLFFLTQEQETKPTNQNPTDKTWIGITWDVLHERFTQIRKAKRSSIGPELLVTLDHYLRHLEREDIVSSKSENFEEAKRIATELYSRHKDALDFIFEHCSDPYIDVNPSIRKILQEDTDLNLDNNDCNARFIRFTPKSIRDITGVELLKKWTKSNRPVLFEIRMNQHGVTALLSVGPIKDSVTRSKLVSELYTCLDKNIKPGKALSGWTTISSAPLFSKDEIEVILNENDHQESAKKIVAQLREVAIWKKRKEVADIVKDNLSNPYSQIGISTPE